jgi:hypothetical protein
MQRGQASIEYVVVVALVVAVSVVGATFAAPGLANEVGRGFRRALCVVGGGDCLATERRPCVTATEERDQTLTVHAAFVRIGRHAGILRQDLSDGTVLVTEIEDGSAGGQIGFGARGRLEVAGVDLEGGGELHAAALARLGHSRTFHVRDRHAAGRLIDRLVHGSPNTLLLDLPRRLVNRALGRGDGLPRADRITFTAGADAEAVAQLPGLANGAELNAALRASLGGRLDRRTGRRTLFFDVGGEAAGTLRTAVAQGRLGGAGRLGLAVTYDRGGRPLLLIASVAGDAEGRLGAPHGLPARARIGGGGARRVELDARLDLTVSDNADSLRRLLAALAPFDPRPAAAAAAARDIASRLARDGDLDARAYTTSSSTQAVGADAALGARLGGEIELMHGSSRLRSAWNRPAGGVWERRVDCVPG